MRHLRCPGTARVSFIRFRRLTLAGAVLGLAAVSGCAQPNDMPRLKEEALASIASYQAQLGELEGRVLGIAAHPPTDPLAIGVLMAARRTLGDARDELAQERRDTEAAAATGRTEDVEKVISQIHERGDNRVRLVTSEVAAVETQAASAERQPAPPAPPAEPASPSGPAAPGADSAPSPAPASPPVR